MTVNPGEMLTIIFDLVGGQTFGDVLAELATADLRVGIHVQGFATGGSESFVNNVNVPDPTTMSLLGISLIGLVGAGTRKKNKKKAVDNS